MEKTGNIIPIDQNLIMSHMFSLLKQYDIDSELKSPTKIDPYRDDLIMKTTDDRYIEIPREIQKYAVQKWIEMKGHKYNKPSYEQIDYLFDEENKIQNDQDDNTDDDKACQSCRKERKESEYTLIDTSFQLILCLIIIFVLLYALSSIRCNFIKY